MNPFNFYITYIGEFADLIGPHIEFIEEGIRSQESADKEMRLDLLESLKSEAQGHRASMTFHYWFNLNFRLSILATSIDENAIIPQRHQCPNGK